MLDAGVLCPFALIGVELPAGKRLSKPLVECFNGENMCGVDGCGSMGS